MKGEQYYAIGAAKQRREFMLMVEEVRELLKTQNYHTQFIGNFVCDLIIEKIKKRRKK